MLYNSIYFFTTLKWKSFFFKQAIHYHHFEVKLHRNDSRVSPTGSDHRQGRQYWLLLWNKIINTNKPVVAQGHKVWLWNRLVVFSIPARGNEYKMNIFIYIYIFIPLLWCRGKARRWVPPHNTQCLQNSAECGERSVLTLDSPCLPCCVRDTAWSWFILIK